jgi:hypothetical protein
MRAPEPADYVVLALLWTVVNGMVLNVISGKREMRTTTKAAAGIAVVFGAVMFGVIPIQGSPIGEIVGIAAASAVVFGVLYAVSLGARALKRGSTQLKNSETEPAGE